MDWGMSNRMSKIIKSDGKTVMLAVDHGYFMGPTSGLENLGEAVKPLLPHADVLMPTRGALRNYIPEDTDVPIVLRVSGGTSILNPDMLHEGIVCSIDDAVRLNVAGIAFSILVGSSFERDTILGFTEMCDDANALGIPTLAVTAVGRDMVRDARYMSLASRMAAELGASIVKTYYVEGFEKVVDTCPVPVVIAGGKKTSEEKALETAHNAIAAGAAGVDMGRNIFQSEDPAAMIQAVGAVVHKGLNPKEGFELFNELKGKVGVTIEVHSRETALLRIHHPTVLRMRVAMYYSNSDVRVEDQPIPEIGPGEVLIKVEACGICGSDVMEWYRVKKAPKVLGHEVAGTVAEVGDGVHGWNPGDRIVATHHVPCNSCRYCLDGHHSVCDTLRTTNFHPGGFSEYLRLPAENVDRGLFRLPQELSFVEGTFVEPLGCVVRGQRFAGVSESKSVLVIGAGITGMLHIKLAKAQAAGPIFATDVNDYRVKMAERVGADRAFNASPDSVRTNTGEPDTVPNIPELVKEANNGCPVDIVIVCTGAPSALEQGLASVDRGGTVLFFAPSRPEQRTEIDIWELWKNEITLTTSYAASERELLAAIALMQTEQVTVGDMVTHRLPLDETQDGFRLTAEAGESMKVVVEPWE